MHEITSCHYHIASCFALLRTASHCFAHTAHHTPHSTALQGTCCTPPPALTTALTGVPSPNSACPTTAPTTAPAFPCPSTPGGGVVLLVCVATTSTSTSTATSTQHANTGGGAPSCSAPRRAVGKKQRVLRAQGECDE